METKGLDRLIKHMRAMHDNIDDDIDFILEMNAKEGVGIAQKKAKEVMIKGYWTGNLWRQIEYQKVGNLANLSHILFLLLQKVMQINFIIPLILLVVD